LGSIIDRPARTSAGNVAADQSGKDESRRQNDARRKPEPPKSVVKREPEFAPGAVQAADLARQYAERALERAFSLDV
jgi:hypothetical protein